MEVTRQEVRGRESRSRKDVSNKENICPLQGRGSVAAEMARRRSPLPEGFPRSPLQDITHIICPHNIWPDNEDPLADQVRKKFRKDNSAESCTASEMGGNSSWKGLAPCLHAKSGTKVVQLKESTKEMENSKQNSDVEAVSISGEVKNNKHEHDLCIRRDEASNDAISLPNCEVESAQKAKNEEQSKQTGAFDTRAHVIQHKKFSTEDCVDDLKQNTSSRYVQRTVGRENWSKRLPQPAQSKKKGSILMFR